VRAVYDWYQARFQPRAPGTPGGGFSLSMRKWNFDGQEAYVLRLGYGDSGSSLDLRDASGRNLAYAETDSRPPDIAPTKSA